VTSPSGGRRELWVAGDLLTEVATLEHGSVVLELDVPRAELPWLALHPAGEGG
jgi:hypothetical protein